MGLIGIAIDSSSSHIEDATTLARLADAHEADFITVPDHPYLPKELEALTVLSTLAARTRHVAVATNVASLALRPPAMLAKAASTLQLLTGGRVVLGIGAGGPLEEIAAFGGAARSAGGVRRRARRRPADDQRVLGALGQQPLRRALLPVRPRAVRSGSRPTGTALGRRLRSGRVLNVLGMISDSRLAENGRRLGFDSFVFWPVGGDRVAQTKSFLEEVRPRL